MSCSARNWKQNQVNITEVGGKNKNRCWMCVFSSLTSAGHSDDELVGLRHCGELSCISFKSASSFLSEKLILC